MCALQFRQRFNFDRSMADDVEQSLMTPDIASERSDIEIADNDRWFAKAFRPAGHPLKEIELLAEFRIQYPVGNVAPGRDVYILQTDAGFQSNADVPRLAIVLPVVLARVLQRGPAKDRDSVVHTLPVELLMPVSVLREEIGRENAIEHLRFLEAQDIRLLFCNEALNEVGARTNGVDIPGDDLELGHGRRCKHARRALRAYEKGPRSGGMERGPTERLSRKGSAEPRVTGGNPGRSIGPNLYLGLFV